MRLLPPPARRPAIAYSPDARIYIELCNLRFKRTPGKAQLDSRDWQILPAAESADCPIDAMIDSRSGWFRSIQH